MQEWGNRVACCLDAGMISSVVVNAPTVWNFRSDNTIIAGTMWAG
jgi:hypothetical protein